MNAAPRFITLLTNANENIGHEVTYAAALSEALTALGWESHVCLPKKARLSQSQANWHATLEPPPYRGATWRDIAQFSKSLAQTLTTLIARDKPAVLFLETFALPHLLALLMALVRLTRRDLQVWLLYRFNFQSAKKALVYRAMNALIEWLIGRGNLVHVTDSETMRTMLQPMLHAPMYVLPVVPTRDAELQINAQHRQTDVIACWWPGRPLPEKGLRAIEQFARVQSALAVNVELMVAQSAHITQLTGACKVVPLPDAVDRARYWQLMRDVDVVLLPYEPSAYRWRTSGVFTEAISIGQRVAVTPDTWAADELRRYDLGELILQSWQSERIVEDVCALAHRSDMQVKLERMQAAYCEFHCQRGFARAFDAIYQQTRGS